VPGDSATADKRQTNPELDRQTTMTIRASGAEQRESERDKAQIGRQREREREETLVRVDPLLY